MGYCLFQRFQQTVLRTAPEGSMKTILGNTSELIKFKYFYLSYFVIFVLYTTVLLKPYRLKIVI